MPSERTPLRTGQYQQQVPPYVFVTSYNRAYRSKVRRFQCCLCAALLAVFITALVITVSMSVNEMNAENDTDVVPTSPAPQVEPLQTLLTMSWPVQDNQYGKWDSPPTEEEIKEAIEEGKKQLQQKEALEEFTPTLEVDSPSYRHHVATSTHPRARELSRVGFIMEGATKHLAKRRPKMHNNRRSHEITVEWLPKEICSKDAPNNCPLSPFRSADGSCNNLKHPRTWGVAMRPFRRILPPEYADGISSPRKAGDGSPLPPAREISLTINRPFYRDDPNFTVMLAVWGQFIDHDITATAISQGTGGRPISCCFSYYEADIQPHPECYTVLINSPDPYFEQYNVTCMQFVRSSPAPVCSFGPREQLNQASSFLDGSVVYGTSDKLMAELRTLEGGELKMLVTPDGRELLPVSTDASDGCNQEEQLKNGRYCFLSGDPRSNENIHLTTMHLLFSRQHNKIARKLATMNPSWNDEKLFQESRKIVTAQIQHITYKEFLPVILGPHLMKKLKMVPRTNGIHSETYDPELDPSIANSFASSAFRFGHTLLPGLVRMISGDNSSEEYREMHKMLFNPFDLYDKGFLEKSVRGAMNTPVEKVDTYFNSQFSNHLFERKPSVGRPKGLCGLDLVSLNIQRGRDHGLPGYPAFREHCGLSRPRKIEDMAPYLDEGSYNRIKRIYKTADDVDMYTGALAEIPLKGSLVGPTVTCLLTDQFLRLQRGDRYWYETSEQPQAFTNAQLKSIQETTLAKIICETSGIDRTQPLVMRGKSERNSPTECKNLPDLDFNAWKEDTSRTELIDRDRPGKIWLIKSTSPTKPTSYRLSGNVTSGFLSVEGSTVWNGAIPARIPTKVIQSVFSRSAPSQYPPAFGQGVLWKGNVSVNGNIAAITGQYSLPQYSVTSTGENQETWYNGDFSVTIGTNFNPFNENISLVQSYTSPVFLHGGKSLDVASEGITQLPTGSQFPTQNTSENVAQIILVGTFTEDKSEFIWTGKVILRLPSITKPELPNTEPDLQMAFTPNTYVDHLKMGGVATKASLSVMGSTIWNGELPLEIPLDPFDVDETGDGTILYGNGINWKGTIDSAANATLDKNTAVDITVSVPILVPSDGISPFATHWYNGKLSMNYDLRWWGNCNDTITYDGDFTTFVHLADRRQYRNIVNESKATLLAKDLNFAGSPTNLGGMRSDIILLGAYSADGKSFYWSGNFTLIMPKVLPTPSKEPLLTAPSPASKSNVRTPLRLVGGQVNVDGWNIWYNDIPVAIPVHPFDAVALPNNDVEEPQSRPTVFGHGILWNGASTVQGKDFIKISGTFAWPKYIHSASTKNFSVHWLNGNFDLQFQTNSSVNISGVFSTSLHFSEKPYYETLREGPMNRLDDLSSLGLKATDVPTDLPGDPETYRRGKLILMGAYSRDRTEFLWSGECILILPPIHAAKSLTLLKVYSPQATKIKFGGSALKANLTIGGVQQTNLKPPLLLSTTVLDSILSMRSSVDQPATFAQGLVWKAKINETGTSALITGSYSFPTDTNGTVSWYNGNFSIEMNVLWKNSNLTVDGSFSSPVYLRDNSVANKNVPSNEIPGNGPYISTDIPLVGPDNSESAPLILGGQYSIDKTSFLWSGDITFILPSPPKLLLLAEPNSESIKQFSVFAFANGGSITVSGQTVWLGNRLPLSIPVNQFERLLLHSGNSGIQNRLDGYGIPWQGFISADNPETLKVWGSYSLPRVIENNTIVWYNGDFAFDLKIMSELPGEIDVQGNYFSFLRLRESEGYQNLEPEWSLQPESVAATSPSIASTSNATLVPIILHGIFSPDKTHFNWSGNVTFVFNKFV